mmetsp:Transcript_7893/g.18373  ORF Transcript_7893/g.18373 Transcript_7893/m.18373 type:complete len:105 (+) Transcript_7893:522-836(+)
MLNVGGNVVQQRSNSCETKTYSSGSFCGNLPSNLRWSVGFCKYYYGAPLFQHQNEKDGVDDGAVFGVMKPPILPAIDFRLCNGGNQKFVVVLLWFGLQQKETLT